MPWIIRLLPLHFDELDKGPEWERKQLAECWGYRSFNAIARRVFTPVGQNLIARFVTMEKQDSLTQYEGALVGDVLFWTGEAARRIPKQTENAARNRTPANFFGIGSVKKIKIPCQATHHQHPSDISPFQLSFGNN